MDHRFFDIKTNVILSANGSSRLKLDRTDILVAVKVSIEEPDTLAPDIGKACCSVECAPSASQNFEGRGADALNLKLTRALQDILHVAVDKKALCIVPRKQCWVVHVDAVVLDSSGNLADAISMAAYAALHTTTIPAIQVVTSEESKETVVEVSDDPYETTDLVLHKVPIIVSLTKIGGSFVVDATAEEEACMSAKVTFAVDGDGKICSSSKSGIGGLSKAILVKMMGTAGETGQLLVAKLKDKIENYEPQEIQKMT
eukprot:CAMPEP_0184493850 /NCGR_PEP_ID=MMETSP0113_2-20130426/27128_1 /TAXON_ID=91329 /ORGANISM="Norrisiella sphaerica, Strain BC52" /LENGTH=256 /DNA_ID=CAMNT_0026879311 /DNA_START=197 /DNA_END=967 /DNA_ORIENTATION=-